MFVHNSIYRPTPSRELTLLTIPVVSPAQLYTGRFHVKILLEFNDNLWKYK